MAHMQAKAILDLELKLESTKLENLAVDPKVEIDAIQPSTNPGSGEETTRRLTKKETEEETDLSYVGRKAPGPKKKSRAMAKVRRSTSWTVV